MAQAIDLIVEGYVRLNDQAALEHMREHRQGLLRDLHERGGFDYTHSFGRSMKRSRP